MRKLYIFRYELVVYALGGDQSDAEMVAEDAWNDASPSECLESCAEVQPGDTMEDEWEPRSLVYHTGRSDIELGSVWPREESQP